MFKARKVPRGMESSDEALLGEFLLSGSAEHLAVLFGRYSGLIYGVCLKYVDQEEARDLTMSLYGQLGEKIRKHEILNFRAWLYRVVQNHCLSHLRRAKREESALLAIEFMENGDVSHHEEKEFHLGALEKCLEQLNEFQRKTVELFYIKELCYQEIASLTGFALLSVKSYIQNGKRNLKICIEKYRETEIDR